jgi:hypothetical protein
MHRKQDSLDSTFLTNQNSIVYVFPVHQMPLS